MTSFTHGGSERNLLFSIDWEMRHGYEVHVAVGRESLADMLPLGVQVQYVPTLVRRVSPPADVRAYRELRALTERLGADVVHTHQSKAGIIGRLAARGRTKVLVHTVHLPSFGPAYSPLASRCFLAAERYCATFTDLLITVGDDLRTRYLSARVGKPEQYVLVRSPIDIAGYARARMMTKSERDGVRRRMGIPLNASVLLAVGTLEKRKRFDLMIKRLAPLLRDPRRDVLLVIAGSGNEYESLELTARRVGVRSRVFFPGHIERLAELFGIARLLVHTSRAEGLAQVVVQAVAAGIPVVATRADGLTELTAAGITILPRDAAGLSRECGRLLELKPTGLSTAMLAPWSFAEIERQLQFFHLRLEEVLSTRRSGPKANSAA
jgi:glycosyltransferase involved in cell wall biosynthesis